METTQVTDLYQASFLLVNGCTIEGIECIPMGGNVGCRIAFSGEGLDELTQAWFDKQAAANLWAFRSAYNQINSWMSQAKKAYDHAQRRAKSLDGGRP
jgi:hypothetical protein